MASNHETRQLAAQLKQILGLAVEPIAIMFQATAPSGIEAFGADRPSPTEDGRTGAVSAGCVFWIEAASRAFSTVPSDHHNCSVGCVTHGIKTVPEVVQNDDIRAVVESGWVAPEDFGSITAIRDRPNYILYGPAAEMQGDVSVILLRLNGKQQMFLHDAWPDLRFEGKPQCHIVAIAKEQGQVAISVGCMLSRVRTGMSNNEVTCALPPSVLPDLIRRLLAAKEADTKVAAYAAADAQRFATRPRNGRPSA